MGNTERQAQLSSGFRFWGKFSHELLTGVCFNEVKISHSAACSSQQTSACLGRWSPQQVIEWAGVPSRHPCAEGIVHVLLKPLLEESEWAAHVCPSPEMAVFKDEHTFSVDTCGNFSISVFDFPQRWKPNGSLGWKRHYYFANKAVLLRSNSRYFPARCLPLLWAVHMPPLIPHRPRGRLGDYPCGSWETQNTSRSILLWLTARNPPEALHPSSAWANHSLNRPQTTLQIFCLTTNLNLSLIWHTD